MRGQVNAMDFAIGTAIFLLSLTAFFAYTNTPNFAEHDIDAIGLSERLLTTGYPEDWNATNVIAIGILTNGSIDPDKWNTLVTMSTSAQSAKIIRGSYRISAPHTTLPIITNDAAANLTDQRTVRRVERISAYEGRIVTIEVLAWP